MAPPPSDTRRVAAALSRAVRDKAPGDRVGSVRSLAAEYEVSVDVARRALQLLVRHGLIRAEARQHVVADPGAELSTELAVSDLLERVAALEDQLAKTQASGDERVGALEDQVGEMQARLADLYARDALPYRSQQRHSNTG